MKIMKRISIALCSVLTIGMCGICIPENRIAADAEVALTSYPVQVGIDESILEEEVAHYEQVASSSELTMFADMEKGWFAIRNNVSDYWWYSHPNNVLTDSTTTGALRRQLRSDLVVGYMYSDQISSGGINYADSQTGPVRDKAVSVSRIFRRYSGGL